MDFDSLLIDVWVTTLYSRLISRWPYYHIYFPFQMSKPISSQQRIVTNREFWPLHQKREEWSVPHAPTKNSALVFLFKITRLNRYPFFFRYQDTIGFQQRTPTTKNGKTHCSPLKRCTVYSERSTVLGTSIFTENTALCYRKRRSTGISSKLKRSIRQQDTIPS